MASLLTHPIKITHVLETILYVRDIEESITFYSNAFGIKPYAQLTTDGIVGNDQLGTRVSRGAFIALGNTSLFLFKLGDTETDLVFDGQGMIPGNGPTKKIVELVRDATPNSTHKESLRQHFCLAVEDVAEIDALEAQLKELGVKVLSTMRWNRGGKSVYFEDPDGHVGEVVSQGIWPHY